MSFFIKEKEMARKPACRTAGNFHASFILDGDFGELLAVKLYAKTPVSESKYIIVAYKEITYVDGFIITAYFSRRLSKRRKIIWKP